MLIPIGLVVGVIAIIAAIVSGVQSAVSDGDLPVTPGADPGRGEVNVLSAEGFADLVAALEEETGSSTVFEAVLYPGYAVVGVPVDATSDREHSFYWDGDLEETGSKSTTAYERFDLADIDPTVVVSVVDQARAKVEDPQSWYSIVRAPSRHGRRHLDLGLRDQRVRRVRLPRQRPGGHHHLGPRPAPEQDSPKGFLDSATTESTGLLLSDGDHTESGPSPRNDWMTFQEVGRWLERRPNEHVRARPRRTSISCWAPTTWPPSGSPPTRSGRPSPASACWPTRGSTGCTAPSSSGCGSPPGTTTC